MKNKKYYPFERNNYFFGKLLTVRDFENEQRYNNDKRRLVNRFLNGPGVVTGLDVVLVDDQTISVEPGMALDFQGREIIVDEPIFKKINMIEGFETLKGKKSIYLCIAYEEEMAEEVFSMANNSQNAQESNDFNRIKESYRLYFTDRQPDESKWSVDSLVECKYVLFEGEGVRIEQIVPKFVNEGKPVEITVNIEKSNLTSPVKLEYIINSDIFKTDDGNNELKVLYSEKEYMTDKKISLKYSMKADGYKNTTGKFTVLPEEFKLSIGDKTFDINTQRVFSASIIDKPIRDAVIDEYYKKNIDDLADTTEAHNIYLAKLNIVTAQNIFIVEYIDKMPYKQYVLSNELLSLLWRMNKDNYGMSTESVDSLLQKLRDEKENDANAVSGIDNSIRTGVEAINLGLNPKVNMSFFSSEIAHGLGAGDVFVVLSLEDDNEGLINIGKQSIFGSLEVFEKSPYESSSPKISLGAVAYKEKGTIRIGIKLLERTELQSINIRWWVYKAPADSINTADSILGNDVKVFIEPNVLNVEPLGKGYFRAVVNGTSDKTVNWSIVEAGGGQIDKNGVYEAPSKEGVYEIEAESIKYPEKKATAYVVVKGKDFNK